MRWVRAHRFEAVGKRQLVDLVRVLASGVDEGAVHICARGRVLTAVINVITMRISCVLTAQIWLCISADAAEAQASALRDAAHNAAALTDE